MCLFGILGMGRLMAQEGMQVEIGADESRIGRVVIHRGLVLGLLSSRIPNLLVLTSPI